MPIVDARNITPQCQRQYKIPAVDKAWEHVHQSSPEHCRSDPQLQWAELLHTVQWAELLHTVLNTVSPVGGPICPCYESSCIQTAWDWGDESLLAI